MEDFGPVHDAVSNYHQFIMCNDVRAYGRNPDEEQLLQTYIMCWLFEGEGVKATMKSHELYLKTAFHIGGIVFRSGENAHIVGGPTEIRRERPVLRDFHEPGYEDSAFLERETYEWAVFQYEEREAERLALLARQPADPSPPPEASV